MHFQKIKMAQRDDEKLCLQWNYFQHNLTLAFKDMRTDKEFTDVTLVCEDDKQMKAHKVVLVSSSPFFLNLLQRNKHPHPLIYMRGVKSEVLVAVMDFIYLGEANVYQENLDSFLAIAEEFRLKGLQESQRDDMSEINPPTNRPPKHNIRTIGHENEDNKCDSCSKVFSNIYTLKTHAFTHTQKKVQCQECFEYVLDLKGHTRRKHSDDVKPVKCSNCGTDVKDIRKHEKVCYMTEEEKAARREKL